MNAIRKIANFFRSTFSMSRTSAKRDSVRLGVETLENRLVPSASSLGLHAVQEATGATVAFFRSPVDNAFYEKAPAGNIVKLSAANTIGAFSAGLDYNGHAEVFAFRSGALSLYNATGWHTLTPPMGMLSFAAVNGGRAYAQGSNHSVWEFQDAFTKTMFINIPRSHVTVKTTVHVAARWTKLPGVVSSLDAVTQSSGADAIFAIDTNNRLREFKQGAWSSTPLDIGVGINAYSAGLDVNGNACAYVLNGNSTIDRVAIGNGGAQYIADGDAGNTAIRATAAGEFIELTDGTLLEHHDVNGNVQIPGSTGIGQITDISAAGADEFFVMTAGGYLKEYTAGGWYSFN